VGGVCVGEVEFPYLQIMKKQFFFLFFLFFSTLTFAQSSLDSLRLVLPERHDQRSFITNFHQFDSLDKIISIGSDGRAFLFDLKTKYRLARFQLEKYAPISKNNEFYISRFDNETTKIKSLNNDIIYDLGIANCIYSDFFNDNERSLFVFKNGEVIVFNFRDSTLNKYNFGGEYSSVKMNSSKSHLLIFYKNAEIKIISLSNMNLIYHNRISEKSNHYLSLFDFDDIKNDLILFYNDSIDIKNINSDKIKCIPFEGMSPTYYHYAPSLGIYFISDESGNVFQLNTSNDLKMFKLMKYSSIVTSIYYSKVYNSIIIGTFNGDIIKYNLSSNFHEKLDEDLDVPIFFDEENFRNYFLEKIIPIEIKQKLAMQQIQITKTVLIQNFIQHKYKFKLLKDNVYPDFQSIKKKHIISSIELHTIDTCVAIYNLLENRYLLIFTDSVVFYDNNLKKYKSLLFEYCENYFFNSKNQQIILQSWAQGLTKFDLENNSIKNSIDFGNNCFAVSDDTMVVACGDLDGYIHILRYSDLKKIRSFNLNFDTINKKSDNPIQNIFFTSENYVVSKIASTRFSVINYKKNFCFDILSLPHNNYLVKLPNSPYYMCSRDASKMLHYVTPSLKVIGFEQLDPVYNRPDIVLDSIGKYFGGADQELVANYRQSWEKRIDRLGLDKEKLGKGEIVVPSAEIVGADAIAYENKNGKLDIKVAANDPKYPLRRFNVYVNEVPLYGSAGISIAHLKKQVWDTTVSTPLSIGENKIQVSVMNELGLENFKYASYVNYKPLKPIVAKTYYIGIGVNEFKVSSHDLKYCVKDVTDLSSSFGSANTEIKLLTNAQVTKENILALKQYLLDSTSVNDKVIISCSSHGLLDDSLNFYLATHDVDFKNPELRGLKYEELESLLDGIPARQKLLLLDACNSGENDKTEILKNELQQNQTIMDSTQILAARGVIIKLENENKSNFKKMNELFVNVRNNTGSVIISAAGGQESALEAIELDGKNIENGAFTYSILEYLNINKTNLEALTVNKLKNYAEKRVEELTNGKQKPTSRQETMEVDWNLR
jgi:hypothetical protein